MFGATRTEDCAYHAVRRSELDVFPGGAMLYPEKATEPVSLTLLRRSALSSKDMRFKFTASNDVTGADCQTGT